MRDERNDDVLVIRDSMRINETEMKKIFPDGKNVDEV